MSYSPKRGSMSASAFHALAGLGGVATATEIGAAIGMTAGDVRGHLRQALKAGAATVERDVYTMTDAPVVATLAKPRAYASVWGYGAGELAFGGAA